MEEKQESSGKLAGFAIVIGMSDVDGYDKDTEHMKTAFETLNFAVVQQNDLDRKHLLALVEATVAYDFPQDIKTVALYYAGHGGNDKDDKHDEDDGNVYLKLKNDKVHVKTIVSQYYPKNAHASLGDRERLFFFDACLGSDTDGGWRDGSSENRKPYYALPAHSMCLIAYATSVGFKARGDSNDGGYWTRNLHQNIIEDRTITDVLNLTWMHTVRDTSAIANASTVNVQGPFYTCCIGLVNLLGKFPFYMRHYLGRMFFHIVFFWV